MNSDSISFSKKGLGNGFISKSDRFKNNSLFYSRFMPGPGSYSTATHQDSLLGSSVYSKKFSQNYKKNHPNSVFIPHETKSLRKKSELPGPGWYKIE